MMPIRAAMSGFTLMEALIALAILSLLLATIFGSLRVTSRSWEVAARHSENNEALRLGVDFMRRQIEQAIPLRMNDGEEVRLLFVGESERLRFASPLPMHAGGASIHWLVFEVSEAGDGRRSLRVSYGPLDALRELPDVAGADPAGMESVSVIEGIGGVSFRYFGSVQDGRTPAWHDTWNHKSRLPELVQLVIHAGSNPQQWPELLIPLRVDTQPARPPFLVNVSSTVMEPPDP